MILKINDWNIEEQTGYKPKTTYYTDLSVAERFGISELKDFCNEVFNERKDDTEYFTEFIMALNWKCWEHYERNSQLSKAYCELYEKYDDYVYNNWNEEQRRYYFEVTD